jgi:hypothetical protein
MRVVKKAWVEVENTFTVKTVKKPGLLYSLTTHG